MCTGREPFRPAAAGKGTVLEFTLNGIRHAPGPGACHQDAKTRFIIDFVQLPGQSSPGGTFPGNARDAASREAMRRS